MITIVVLISLGVLLIALDIIFVPGMILGIFGGLILIAGVISAFISHGMEAGTIALAIAFGAIIILMIYAFKTDVWSKFALKTKVDGRVNEEAKPTIFEGQTGKAISALRPSGKADFDGQIIEVTTYGSYCPQGQELVIEKIELGKVWVSACS